VDTLGQDASLDRDASNGQDASLDRDASPVQGITLEELQLAARNHGMPLEALRYDVTPVGMHYLLTHFDVPGIDAGAWSLAVGGLVRRPLTLTLDDLRSRTRVTAPVTFECAGNGRARLEPRPVSQPWLVEAVGTGEWTGTPLRPLLEEAGLADGAVEVVFTGVDRGVEHGVEQDYQRSLSLDEALRDGVLLAYELNGQPLPPQHGFPLRLVVPGWYGMTNVKWLRSIEAVAEPFAGPQQARSYRFYATEDEPGPPVTRMAPRALMLPPGIPEFMTRSRYLPPEPCELTGRAWSGWGSIERVEVTTDGGSTWSDAALDEHVGPSAWRGWRFAWEPPAEGAYRLGSRASDAAGNRQPVEPPWNVKGYANNAVQWIDAIVRGREL
jgi:DMSO/TMAO reductase YedYZ molybdopterin-dependent catalytic subunit